MEDNIQDNSFDKTFKFELSKMKRATICNTAENELVYLTYFAHDGYSMNYTEKYTKNCHGGCSLITYHIASNAHNSGITHLSSFIYAKKLAFAWIANNF